MTLKSLTKATLSAALALSLFVAPLLLAQGVLPGWAALPVALLPLLVATMVALNMLRDWRQRLCLLSVPLGVCGAAAFGLLSPAHVSLCDFLAMFSLLFWMFARTLRPGQTPLCTQFAALVHDTLSSATRRYTRGLTVVWVMFFALQIVVGGSLFFILPTPIWLRLAGVVSPLLVGALFVLDWLARHYFLPVADRKDAIKLTIRAMRQYRQNPTPKVDRA